MQHNPLLGSVKGLVSEQEANGRLDPRDGYVIDPNAKKFFAGVLAVVESYIDQDLRWQAYAENAHGPDVVLEFGNNGALYFEEIRDICQEALGLGRWSS